MSDLAAVFASGRGCARRSDLVAAGFTARAISSMVKSGVVQRVRIGWYAPRRVDPALKEAVRIGGRLACVSAARHLNLWAPEGSTLHVSVPANASRFRAPRSAKAELHWLPDAGVRSQGASNLSECLGEIIVCQPAELAVAIVDSALHRRAIGATKLRKLLSESARGRVVLALVDARSESGIESIARVRLRWAGIDCKIQIKVAPGIRVDLLIDGWLVVELDGSSFHSGPKEFEKDRRRDALLAVWGYRVLHFSYRQVMDDWEFVFSTISAVRAQGGTERSRLY